MSHADPVMTVLDNVLVAKLDQIHLRKAGKRMKRGVKADPAFGIDTGARQEVACKVVRPTDTAHDAANGHLVHACIAPLPGAGRTSYLVKAQQASLPSS
jgi:hypothetical protein